MSQPLLHNLWALFQTAVPTPLGGTTVGEIIANLFGIFCVYLCTRENVWNWPTGIANSFFLIFLFVPARLYADAGLQGIYIVLGLYGWWAWLYGGKDRTELPISRTPPTLGGLLLTIAVVGTLVLGRFIHYWTDTDVPYWDAGTTVVCLVAQYMITRKLLENWPVWILTNISYIALYIHKHLYLTAGVQVLFIVLSVLGLLEWTKTLYQQERLARTAG